MISVLFSAFGIGIAAGLRSFMAPAVVCWAAYLGWINVSGTPLWFMGSVAAVAFWTILASVELIADKHPKMSSRTAPPGLIARIVTGGLCGAVISSVAGLGIVAGAIAGIIGGVVSAFAGYEIRSRLCKVLGVRDLVIAIPEDLIAIGLAVLMVYPR